MLTFLKRLTLKRSLPGLHEAARSLDPNVWHRAILASATDRSSALNRCAFPGFPPENVQRQFNGQPATESLKRAYDLYQTVMETYRKHGPSRSEARFLDFGAGWGRVWRYFIRDFPPSNLLAYDVMPSLAAFWAKSMLGATLDIGEAYKRLPYEDASIDLVVSNSVFSHLSEHLNLWSAQELRRVMRPGAVFVGTTYSPAHLQRWQEWHRTTPSDLTPTEKLHAQMDTDFEKAIADYRSGKFVWLEEERGERRKDGLLEFQIAAFNGKWIEVNWPFFEPISFDDSGSGQAQFRLRAR